MPLYRLRARRVETFFAHPRAPWLGGISEHTSGLHYEAAQLQLLHPKQHSYSYSR